VLPLDSSTLDRASAADPQWLAERRKRAFDVFSGLELPSEREEVWRYVELDLDLSSYAIPQPNGSASSDGPRAAATIVDGAVVAATGGTHRLAEALAASPDRIEEIYGSLIPVDDDIFTAAHHAFASDAVVVSVPAGEAIADPIRVDVRASAEGGISFPHLLLDAADGSQASVVVEYSSPHDLNALVAPHIEVLTGANTNLSVTIVQNWGYATTALSQCHVGVGRDSSFTLAEAGLGGSLARLRLTVDLVGRGSSATVLGAYFGEQTQLLDYRYFMRHVGENTRSDMFLKGAVEDEALSVFTGMIRIEESAQKTDAFQTNRNLILSEGAAAQSVPNLEILANDVRCGHGSTVGPLDAEQRYYLMSRGLDRQRSDRLQVHGFFEEVLSRFPERAVAGPVRDAINAKYVAAQREGRV